MARKFSDISPTSKIGLINLIESKKLKFRTRVTSSQQQFADAFDSNMEFLLNQQIRNIDTITISIFDLIKNNPDVEMTELLESLWADVGGKYSTLYSTIENFNESGPGVDAIISSSEWTTFYANAQQQLHEYDNFQGRISGRFEKIKDLETRSYTLFALIKSAIIEFNGRPQEIQIPKEIEDSKEIAMYLLDNKDMLNSAIQSAESAKQFSVNNIDEALRNVGTMFYYKDMYSLFQKDASIGEKIAEAFVLLVDDLRKSPVWWFLFGLFSLLAVFMVLFLDFTEITSNPGKYKDIWQIILSMHLIGASFLGYFTVFCFSNYKKIEQRHESYRFRGIMTKSFGFLLQTADEEQKKILYPKALDAIFKDLPDSGSPQQDVNINLPITEIMKGFTGK